MIKVTIDSTTEDGCRQLCGRIIKYWRERGFTGVWARPVLRHYRADRRNIPAWGIESNIGLYGPDERIAEPPRHPVPAAA